MVEAPRIRIIYEKVRFTKNKLIIRAYGPSYKKFGINLENYTIRKWWYAGKYIYTYVIQNGYPPYVIRTHMMMYGKIIINHEYEVNPRLRPFLTLELDDNTILQWYLSQIKLLDPCCKTDMIKSNYTICSSKQSINDSIIMAKYDISNKLFDINLLINHIFNNLDRLANDILVDLLLNQEFFPGVGNILQQEALYRCKYLPTKLVKEIGIFDIKCLIAELQKVIGQLYESYLNKLTNKPHKPILQIYHKSICPLGHKTVTKYLGYHNRRTTWCPICQK